MVNREVRRQLLERLRITPQALSQRAGKIKESYGPMTTEEAVYVIAHMEGIDLSKDLSLAELDRVRALVPRQATAGIRRIRQPKPVTRKKRNASSKYPLVEDELVKVADRL